MLMNNLSILLFYNLLQMPVLSDDDSASSDERWCRRRRSEAEAQKARTLAAQAEEERRRARVSEINRQIEMAKGYMFDLQSEKDDLLRRPNPFFNHTKGLVKSPTKR